MRRSGGERPPFAHARPKHIRRGNISPGNVTSGDSEPLLFATENLNSDEKAPQQVHFNAHAQSSPTHDKRTPSAHPGWAARKTADPIPTEDSLHSLGLGNNGVGSADGGSDLTVQILRCMYTNQKTKKRKVWSDGAVKCCSKRQRVSLYRWSDVLGVTDKLLGETYLSVPEYKAFVSSGEPELEMELYIVSLDGVIQETPLAAEGSTGGTVDTDGAGSVANGRKRKLLKPFKPPSRRAPPVAPPADSWSAPRNGSRFGDDGKFTCGDRGSQGGARNELNSRTCYTGFGHVASLWEDDDDEEAVDNPAALSAALADGANGWGVHSEGGGGGYRDRHDLDYGGSISDHSGREEGNGSAGPVSEAAARAMQLSAAAATIATTRNGRVVDMWRGHDDLRAPSSSYVSQNSAEDSLGANDVRYRGASEDGCVESVSDGHEHGRHGNHEHEPYSERFPGERRDAESHRRQSYCQEKENGVGGANADHGAPHQHGDFSAHAIGSSAEQHRTIEHCSPEHGSHGGDGGGEGHARSTQDILSLFGGLADPPLDEQPSASAPDSTQEFSSAAPLESFWMETDSPGSQAPGQQRPLPKIGGGDMVGGRGKAADMRRAQRAAREAQQKGCAIAVVDAAESTSATAHPATSAPAVRPWDCGVCGVGGAPSALSCRVCGAQRQREIGDCREASGSEGDGDDGSHRYDAPAGSRSGGKDVQQPQNKREIDDGLNYGDSRGQQAHQQRGGGGHVFTDDDEPQDEHDDEEELGERDPTGERRTPVGAEGANNSGVHEGYDAAGRQSHNNVATPHALSHDSIATTVDRRQGTTFVTATSGGVCRKGIVTSACAIQRRSTEGMSMDIAYSSDNDSDV